MKENERQYKLDDGKLVPLFEADYDTAFKVNKSDRRGAIIGHPKQCIEAKALCRLPNVIEAYIGTGKDAYIVFRNTPSRNFMHALHFTIPASSAKVRDAFDTRQAVASQILWLRQPSKGRTLDHRRKLDRARKKAVKEGARIKKRGKPAKKRIHRLGVDHRPRARILDNVVSVGLPLEEEKAQAE
jgi:hypothetical protein